MNILLGLEILLYLFVLIYKYYKYKYKTVISISSWFIICYLFYCIYPAFCLDSYIKKEGWEITLPVMLECKSIVFILGLFFIILYSQLTFNIKIHLSGNERCLFLKKVFTFLLLIFLYFELKALFDLLDVFRYYKKHLNYNLFRNNIELIRANYHLGIINYLLCGIFFYKTYYKKYSKLVIIDLLLNSVFDVLAGTRTNFFTVALFIYLTIVFRKKKTYLKPIILCCIVILFSSEIVRSIDYGRFSNTNDSITSKLMLGYSEFNNTFITYPYIIQKGIHYNFNLFEYTSWAFGWIPPLIRIFNISSLGDYYRDLIGRNIGYASNFLTNSVYLYGYFSLILIILFFCYIIYIDKRMLTGDMLVLRILMIIYIRHFIREGFISFSILFYNFIFYFGIFIIFKRHNLKFKKLLNIKY